MSPSPIAAGLDALPAMSRTPRVVLAILYHVVFARAVLDPQGNNKSYTWVDSQAMPAARLNRIAGIRLRLANVS